MVIDKGTKIAILSIIAVAVIAVAGIGYATNYTSVTVNSDNDAFEKMVLIEMKDGTGSQIMNFTFEEGLQYHTERKIGHTNTYSLISSDTSISNAAKVRVRDLYDAQDLTVTIRVMLTSSVIDILSDLSEEESDASIYIQFFDDQACTRAHNGMSRVLINDDGVDIDNDFQTDHDYYCKLYVVADYSGTVAPVRISFDLGLIATVEE